MKNWFKSKTIWFNIVALYIGMLELATPLNIVPMRWLVFLIGMGNLVLRIFFTKEQVK